MHSYTLKVVEVGTRWISFAVILGGLTFQAQLERPLYPNARVGDNLVINAEIVNAADKQPGVPNGETIIDTRDASGNGFRIIYNEGQRMAWYVPSGDSKHIPYGIGNEVRSVSVTPEIAKKIETLRRETLEGRRGTGLLQRI